MVLAVAMYQTSTERNPLITRNIMLNKFFEKIHDKHLLLSRRLKLSFTVHVTFINTEH